MSPDQRWSQLAAPWRDEARGFTFVKRSVELIEGGHRCIDHLRAGATWLDLAGELGRYEGLRAATLITWIEAGDSRFSLTTVGEAVPRPGGFLLGRLVAPLMRKLAPREARPLLLRSPQELKRLIEKHSGELLAIAGRAVSHATLDERFEQARRDDRR